MTRGAIYCEQAYAQGKMLNHSEWAEIMPRGITPSDVDMVCDNMGRMVFCEFSSVTSKWDEIPRGQQHLYWNLVKTRQHVAALCYHEVRGTVQINTLSDVLSFAVMFNCRGKTVVEYPAEQWPRFIRAWFDDDNGPKRVFEKLKRKATEQAAGS